MLVVSAGFILITVLLISSLTVMLRMIATPSVIVYGGAIFLGIFSPWAKYFYHVLSGRYRSFRGVVNAWCHSLATWEPSVPKLWLIRTLSVVVLSGAWATLTLCPSKTFLLQSVCTTEYQLYILSVGRDLCAMV